MVLDFVFKAALRYFDRLVIFVFSVVLLIVGFHVVIFATVLSDSVLFNTKVGFFIIIGRFGSCSLFVVLFIVLFGTGASDVPLIDDISDVPLAIDFSVKLLIDPLSVVFFLIDFSVVFLIILINNGDLSVVLFVARLSVVMINACGFSIQLVFRVTFDLKFSTVLLVVDFGVIKTGSILAADCICSFTILLTPSG